MLIGLHGVNSGSACNTQSMFFNKIGNRKKLKKLKKRSSPGCNSESKARTHFHFLYTLVGGLHEMRLHKIIIRKFRRRTRRRRFKIIFFFLPNYSYSRKSTNSRMGKGKGKFRRLLTLLKAHHPLAGFRGISLARINRFLLRTWDRFHLTLTLRPREYRLRRHLRK